MFDDVVSDNAADGTTNGTAQNVYSERDEDVCHILTSLLTCRLTVRERCGSGESITKIFQTDKRLTKVGGVEKSLCKSRGVSNKIARKSVAKTSRRKIF